MKHRIAPGAIALAFLGASLAAQAVEIHKCAARGGVAYQTAPCAPGQRELAMPAPLSTRESTDTLSGHGTVAGFLPDSARSATPAPTGDARWLPFRQRVIAAGMTDDEVLNAPNGGVPDRIERTRDGRTWRELWLYHTRGGIARALQFVNGRLTGIVDDDAPAASLRLALLGQ